ncbi:DUF4383 domain-containing protein [Saccharothrix sp. S26]|uniref:DUF4383 domain-containing protein n=1 Tax=Saccharothrix sp. S26 TaxID=2907215 RepID=UPI001F1FED68|nr:DUF4383 domain-containing protein [Saccharothrix sp. S26]MCE6995389.1 DUF4383 domain-containing protein [Saccharothrix sp. S26]
MVARAPVRVLALALSALFVVGGIAGFVPGATADHDAMEFAGHTSHALLFGVFQVSVLHNIVHLAFGVAGLALARSVRGCTLFLVVGGIVYLLLWVYGLLVDEDSAANLLPVNSADNGLHAVVGVVMITLGLALGRQVPPPASEAG